MIKKPIRVSVGICAHNEEKNIGQLLKAIVAQKGLKKFIITEILVISSGSTDKTNFYVKERARADRRIKLLVQKKRLGKAAAVNLFLKRAKNRLLILESADTLPSAGAYAKLLTALAPVKVGMVGARIIPLNRPDTFKGFIPHLMWRLHHKLNLQFPERPKIGEVAAFKKLFTQIPVSSAVDEASIEPLIHLQGYRVVYCPEAIIHNRGPETIFDFLRQRRRIYAGHLMVKEKYGYTVITHSPSRILGTLLANFEWTNWRDYLYTPAVIFLELVGRTLGWWDYRLKKKSHTVWEIARTTKKLK